MFAVLVLTMSVVHANFVTNDAKSHWLMGVQLVSTWRLRNCKWGGEGAVALAPGQCSHRSGVRICAAL